MGIMQFNTIKACLLGTQGGIAEQLRQSLRQFGDMRQMRIRHPLAIAHGQIILLALGQNRVEFLGRFCSKRAPDFFLAPTTCPQSLPMSVGDFQKAVEKLIGRWAAADIKKINDLDKEPRLPLAGFFYSLHKRTQSVNEAVMTDPQKRTRRHIAYSRCLDDNGTGATFGKAAIPIKIILRDKAFFV